MKMTRNDYKSQKIPKTNKNSHKLIKKFSSSVMATAPGASFSGSKKVWSDRKAAKDGRKYHWKDGGNITAIFINYRDTGGISMIRTR